MPLLLLAVLVPRSKTPASCVLLLLPPPPLPMLARCHAIQAA
jgi:hypothetical protein